MKCPKHWVNQWTSTSGWCNNDYYCKCFLNHKRQMQLKNPFLNVFWRGFWCVIMTGRFSFYIHLLSADSSPMFAAAFLWFLCFLGFCFVAVLTFTFITLTLHLFKCLTNLGWEIQVCSARTLQPGLETFEARRWQSSFTSALHFERVICQSLEDVAD